jgi:uncharacterized protein (TIGR02246 family)
MNRLPIVVVTAVLCAALMVPPAFAQAGGGTPQPEPAIAKIIEAYVAGMKARDAAKIAELYAEDAVEMPPFQQPVKGRKAIRGYYEQQFKGEQMEFADLRLQRVESRMSGDLAFDTGTYAQKVTPKGGQPTDDTGNYLVILRRAADGQWRVAYAIYNSHVPPTPGR